MCRDTSEASLWHANFGDLAIELPKAVCSRRAAFDHTVESAAQAAYLGVIPPPESNTEAGRQRDRYHFNAARSLGIIASDLWLGGPALWTSSGLSYWS